ncbi:MAG TPA: response regulator transcription factor [Paludibacter sp.]|nr:response regulator transcription factor [Paludibacter sp.]
MKPNVIVVDDHALYRRSLVTMMSVENIANVIGEASDGMEFLQLLPRLKPDLVLMDIDMPGMNGIEASQKALELIPGLKIIIFTMFEDEQFYEKMIEVGAKGYILKTNDLSEIEHAIHNVMDGKEYF